ncbi:hypothetical protein ATCCBAA256_00960 [Mycobacterium montefiorense]|nr:hypothetical protein ATCCBAA256_00960 [Mycobacterium montefiorense]
MAGRDVVQLFFLRVGAQLRDQRTRSKRRMQDRFGSQPAPGLGQHDHDLELARLVRVEAQAQDPGVGELTPNLAAPTEVGADDLDAAFRVIGARQQVAGRVAQQTLLVGQLKVHGCLTIPEWWTR